MKEDNLEYVDALKGIAIIAVTLVHSGGGGLPGIWGRIGNDGARGVQMFFVISGMLAFRSLDHYYKHQDITIKSALRWYVKKFLRIVPLYYLALLMSLVAKTWSPYWLGSEGHVTINNILAHIFLLHGLFPHYTDSILSVEWYLGCLWLFFLVSPLLFKYIDTLGKSVIFGVFLYIVQPLLSAKLAVVVPIGEDSQIYDAYVGTFGPPKQFLVYMFGIILYFVIKRLKDLNIDCITALSYALLIFGIIALYGQVNDASTIYRLSRDEMFGLWFFVIILSQALHSSRLIVNPVFKIFGKYSYGIYLFQFVWLKSYDRYINYSGKNDGEVRFLISLAVLLGISYILTSFFEKPLIKRVCRTNLYKTFLDNQ